MNVFVASAISILVFMVLLFIIAQFLKNNSIVDIAWGMGFVLVNSISMFFAKELEIAQILIGVLVSIWGLRLSVYLFLRNKNKPEDYRYQEMRKRWGNHPKIGAFLNVFLLQGVIMYIIALPIMVVNYKALPGLGLAEVFGLIFWLVGFLLEAVGDYQKSKFKSKPENKGKIMQSGLWRYTRHPNYFGDALLWWGIFFIAYPAGFVFLSIISPIIMNFLLLKVSGVAMLEKKYNDNPEFNVYAEKTNAFIPWFPKE